MAWTDERVETLKKLWTEGLSASQIAQKLGGVTRNAVIGKVHRLGLSGRATPSRPVRRPAEPAQRVKRAPARPAAQTAQPERETAPRPVPVEAQKLPSGEYATVLTLNNHICKWPIGDPDDSEFRFCGRKAGQGSPYCEAHQQMAYQPAKKRRRKTPDADSLLNSLASRRAS